MYMQFVFRICLLTLNQKNNTPFKIFLKLILIKVYLLFLLLNDAETGFRNVHFHVHGNFNDYGREQIENIKATVASIVGCSSEDILVGGFNPSSSFLVVLSIKEIYLKRLCNLDQEDKEKLSRLDIDYFIIDLKVVFVESSKGIYVFPQIFFLFMVFHIFIFICKLQGIGFNTLIVI